MKKTTSILLALLTIASLSFAIAQDDETPPSTDTVSPTPDPTIAITEGDITLHLYSDSIPQGRAGLIRVTGPKIVAAQAHFLGQSIDLFAVNGKTGFYGLLGVNMDQSIRTYDLVVSIIGEDGSEEVIATPVKVTGGGFIQQPVTLPEDRMSLIDPVIESDELTLIRDIAAVRTPQRLWDERGFRFPIEARLTSPFGAVRTFNGSISTRHTGWDFQAQIGIPMASSASGRVAFAGPLAIRGNYVLIDHGYGIYSGYAHLSIIHVTRGQVVAAGQIIGQVGNTGRSSSAHSHLDFLVNGEWVDAVDFIALPLP